MTMKPTDKELAADQVPCVSFPVLHDDEMRALRRFAETAKDDESYDVPMEMMMRLAMFGAVTRGSRPGWFFLTDLGRVLLSYIPATTASTSEAVPAGWISVNDRLPTEADYGDHGDVVVRYRYTDTPGRPWEVGESFHEADYAENAGWCMGSCYYAEVTHWIPKDRLLAAIPAPASGEGQQGEITERLRVFSAGTWKYDGTGQSFSHEDLDAAAFVEYRNALRKATQQQAGQAVAWQQRTRHWNGGAWSEWEGFDHGCGFPKRVGKNGDWHGAEYRPLYTTPQIPDGYVLVPREPTEAMLHAAGRVVFAEAGAGVPMYDPLGFAEQTVTETQGKCYRAMIAASEASGGLAARS